MHPSTHAAAHPEKPAIIVAETGETIRYAELDGFIRQSLLCPAMGRILSSLEEAYGSPVDTGAADTMRGAGSESRVERLAVCRGMGVSIGAHRGRTTGRPLSARWARLCKAPSVPSGGRSCRTTPG